MNLRAVLGLCILYAAFVLAILAAGILAGLADPAGYRAVTLVCPAGLPTSACDRGTALDILTVTPVPTPFACLMGGMEHAARAGAMPAGAYTKIVCERRG